MTRRRVSLSAGLLVLLMAVGACGGSKDGPTVAKETGQSVPSPLHDEARRSQPYWVSVTSFIGTGSTTTRTFSIEANALQWRLSWRCTSAPFTVVSVDGSGKESPRKLAYALSCPKEAQGFSAEKGTQSLKVTSAGEWSVDIAQQIDTPLIESFPSTASTPHILATAKVRNVDREADGTATIYRLADGTRVLRLDDFFVTRNSDLEIRFSAAAVPRTTDEIAAAPFKVIAPLKATVGSMNYDIPSDVDIEQFDSIVIWCEITRNAYAAADLEHQ